jgi:hypothetical protein
MEIRWIIEFAREIKKKGQGGLLEMKELTRYGETR